MYISKLSLYGFKSFSRKSEIHFGKGITSVVGPNGCGKTNIVDAIRWVIGEQKSSVLRADRNTDMIFNGTATRRPLNLAEVSLTIHNVSGRISLPYSDIVITRRVYRNGESEYFINNSLCRLKDITDLFIDTGMGANAYSIIELKMIEDILSENPDERKRLFEEAAGVNKYRVQRKAALRKLEATRDDLTRLNDIINEVEIKVKTLRRQLKRYEKHQETTTKLIDAEVLLATRRISDIQISLNPIESRIAADREKLSKITADLSSRETIWKTRQEEFAEQEQVLEDRNQRLSEIREERNKYSTEKLVLKEQLHSIRQTITRLENDIQQYDSTVKSARQKDQQLQQEYLDITKQLETKRETFTQIEKNREAVEQHYSKANAEIQALQQERFGLFKQQAENSARFGNLQDNIDQREKELISVESQLESRILKDQQIEITLEELQKKKQSLNDGIQTRRKNLDKLEQHHSACLDSERDLQEQRREIESQLDRLNNRIHFYQGIIQSKEGFSPGLQYVLDNIQEFPGIKGALSDLLSVDPKYYSAVEAVIKDISRLLVAQDRQAALQTLGKLANQDKGRISIVPLDATFPVNSGKPVKDLKPLSGFIKCDNAVQNLKEFLFQEIYCCRDDQFETLINETNLKDISIVSDQGRFRDANGFFSGGSESSESNVLVGRTEKLHQLNDEASKIKQKLNTVQEELQNTQNDLAQLRSERTQLSRDIQEREQELQGLQEQVHQNEARIQESKSIRKTLEENRISLKVLLGNFKERINKEDPGKTSLDQEVATLEQRIEQRQENTEQIKQELDQVSEQRQNQRIELINLENRSRNIVDSRELAKRSIQRALESKDQALAEKETSEQEVGNIQSRIQENQERLDESQARVGELEKSIETFRNSFQKIRNEIQQLNDELYQLRHNKEILHEAINQNELEKSDYRAASNEIQSVLLEKYNRNIPEEIPDNLPEKEELRRKVERFKRNLELIGMVNMTVKEEYEEEHSRLTFLTEQRDDLLKSEKGLNDVIVQIDNIAREQYQDIFNKIRQNFKNTFAIFFSGGEADLKMIGDSDPLEAQIEIWACPSGKKMRSLKMLSAGEKALTAIALLFGIYQVKPSPFCILDEVDAPLDDENTRRFTNVIKTFSEKTQFIIVTHNKATMSIADSLYGVTMAESGISQIVSAKLE